MLNRIVALVFAFLVLQITSFANAQNLLVNGDFEAQPLGVGDHVYVDVPGWSVGRVQTSLTSFVRYPSGNIVGVDGGSFGTPPYDATGGNNLRHYLDGTGDVHVWQYFTAPCSGLVRASMAFSIREPLAGGTYNSSVSMVPRASAPFILPQNQGYFAAEHFPELAALISEQTFTDFTFGNGAVGSPWSTFTHDRQVQAGQTYTLMIRLAEETNLDNVSVRIVGPCQLSGEAAVTTGVLVVPPVINSTISSLITTKTCDPVEPVASGLMTLNCQITVTGSNLATGSYATVRDIFFSTQGSVTATGLTSNMTSVESWNCQPVTGSPYAGICQLPAADLLAAGGTSVINTSFLFDVGATVSQVGNCAPGEIANSIFEGTGGNKSNISTDLNLPKSAGSVPEYCALVDVPDNLDSFERVQVEKTCDTPVAGQHNGTQGYLWNCRIAATVTPTPFNGTFELTEDASNISTGQAQFIGSSVPCSGLSTDVLSCTLDGNTMVSPEFIDVQLFAEIPAGMTRVDWQNCAQGSAITGTLTMESGQSCVQVVIEEKEPPKLPVLKDVDVKKACGAEPTETTHAGVDGIMWRCTVTVIAAPVPFAGNFTFIEDASNITGSPNGGIISMNPQSSPNSWTCLNNLPAVQSSCEISGSAFDPSGSEEIEVVLFAPTGKDPIEWKNCVSGNYDNGSGRKTGIKGNCVGTTWKPTDDVDPPKLSLDKTCEGPSAFNGSQRYVCTITVNNSGGPIIAPLTLDELFTDTNGNSATNFLLQLSGSQGWVCNSSPTANCTISPASFNANNNNQISGVFLIPDGDLAERDFKNCAALTIKGEPVAEEVCVSIDEPSRDTVFDVVKECKPSGDRNELSAGNWIQSYSCTITVTTNGVPFTDPLYVGDALTYGGTSGNQSVNQLSSSDPWQCVPPPYAAPGQGNQPACVIQGNDFPHSTGSSTINVMMTLFGALANQSGAENCANVYTDLPSDGSEPIPVAQSCMTIIDPPLSTKPTLDLVKTCSPATNVANGSWVVQCSVTISGTNLPAGQQISLADELLGNGLNTATGGSFSPNFACNSSGLSGGLGTTCNITTDDITNNGGSITLPYFGTFAGQGGRPMPGSDPSNCAFADIPVANLHAPNTSNGKACVSIPLKLSAVGGGVLTNTGPLVHDGTAVINPDLPTGPLKPRPNIENGTAVMNPNILIGTPTPTPIAPAPNLGVEKLVSGECDVNRGNQSYACPFDIRVTNNGDEPYIGPVVLTDEFGRGVVRASNMSGDGWNLMSTGNGIVGMHNNLALAPNQSSTVRTTVVVKGQRNGGEVGNCAAVGLPQDERLRVMLIQDIMNKRGINVGKADGKIGPNTRRGLAQLKSELNLSPSDQVDDALFTALGLGNLSHPESEAQSCATAQLPPMPAPALKCDLGTTNAVGEACVCKYKNSVKQSAVSCGCKKGYQFEGKKGCVKVQISKPKPTLKCDPRSTVKAGKSCRCIIPGGVMVSKTQCGCPKGTKLDKFDGCVRSKPRPKPDAPAPDKPQDSPAGDTKCRLSLNGICISRAN